MLKKNGVVKGKIFDFLPPSANTSDYVRTEQYYNEQFTIPPKGFKSSIIPQDNLTESQLMKDVKLDKDGKFMDKNQRKFANFEKKASFETVVKVSFNESVNRLKDLGATKEELEKLSKYKEEILARGKEEIAKMPKEEQKIISRK